MLAWAMLYLGILISADSLNVTYLGGWSFGPRALAVELDRSRNLLFSGAEGEIFIWDISDPSNPVKLSEFATFGIVNEMSYDSATQKLFVADYNGGLEIWDVSDPAGPYMVGRSYNEQYYPYGVFVRGNYAYVADGDFSIVDISDPSHPREISRIETTGRTEDVCVIGNYAYLAGGFVKIVDISDPYNPVLVDELYIPASKRMEIKDTLLFVSNGWIYVVNVSDPLHPVVLHTFSSPQPVNALYIVENYIYAATDSGFIVIDASTIDSMYVVGSHDLPVRGTDIVGTVEQVFVTTGELYAVHTSGVYAFDISQPAFPVELWHYTTSDLFRSMSISGNYAYLAAGTTGVYVLDVSNPSSVYQITVYNTPNHAWDVCTEDNYAYVADHNNLLIIDISDPSNPQQTASISTGDFCFYVAVKHDTLLVGGEVIWVIDATNPYGPFIVSQGRGVSSIEGVGIQDHYGYAFGLYGTVGVYDLSSIPHDTTFFWPISQCDIGGSIVSGSVSDSIAVAVAHARPEGSIVLLSDPTNIHEISSFTPPLQYPGIYDINYAAIQGDKVFIATDEGIYIYDISDPTNPVLWGKYLWLDLELIKLIPVGTRIYALSRFGGLKIFEYSPQGISDQKNPASEQSLKVIFTGGRPAIRFNLPIVEKVCISVFNVAGRLVWNRDIYPERNSLKLELPNNLRPGIYFVTVRSAHFSARTRLIIFK